jgi:hypothetical protein
MPGLGNLNIPHVEIEEFNAADGFNVSLPNQMLTPQPPAAPSRVVRNNAILASITYPCSVIRFSVILMSTGSNNGGSSSRGMRCCAKPDQEIFIRRAGRKNFSPASPERPGFLV